MGCFCNSERIKKEFIYLNRNPVVNIGSVVALVEENNYYRWKSCLLGPKCTCYSGGYFELEIILPNDYPYSAPKIIFTTPIYHPNVCNCESSNYISLGQVSFNALSKWNSSNTIKEMIIKLYAIFYFPYLACPYSLEIAKEYKENRLLYEKKVQYFVKKYATPFSTRKNFNKFWDFSCNENYLNTMIINKNENITFKKDNYDENKVISITLELNGIYERKVDCKCNELLKDIVKRTFDKNELPEKSNILYIMNSKRIDPETPIGYIGINLAEITIIFDN